MLDRKAIGERLRNLRGDRTLDEVAKELGVTAMAVSLWERGDRTPNDDMKIRIAAMYGCSVTDLFFTDKVNVS